MESSPEFQLAQRTLERNKQHADSSLGRYEESLKNRQTGMLSFPSQDLPTFSNTSFGAYSTPQPPPPPEGGGGGMSVMCGLMHDYGYIDDDVIEVDNLFGKLLYASNPEIIVGYHAWAKPLTEFLRNHAIYIPLFAYTTQAWAYEMAENFGIVKKRSVFSRLLGKIVMNGGKPVCGFIGSLILSMQGNYEYHRT
jgi:hypothetical protein